MYALRWLLLPITLLYGLAVWIRNQLYDLGIFSTRHFKTRTIVIGNLTVGGSGKSPLTQKLIAHFKTRYRLATLSRGYGRKTKGFRFIQEGDCALQSGDEPLQFKKNHPEVTIAVDEQRVRGITILSKQHNLIVLDDAFQHRRITGLCNLLLFDYASISKPLFLLPTGNLRDTMDQTKRADIVLITKCPPTMPPRIKALIEKKINTRNPTCSLYYSALQYLDPVNLQSGQHVSLSDIPAPSVLVTGIANPKPLTDYLADQGHRFEHLSFPDHHRFQPADYLRIRQAVPIENDRPSCILTTEKDTQRLSLDQLEGIDVYYIPIEVCIQNEAEFLDEVTEIID